MAMRKSRKPGNKSTGWIRDTVLRIYTEDMLRKDWEAISPVDRVKVAAGWVPKEMKVESNTTISLIINGIRQAKAIDNTPVRALTQGVVNDDTE